MPGRARPYEPSPAACRLTAPGREHTEMAVPKKKTSKAKSRSRRASAWKLEAPSRSVCPRCNAAKQPHIVCGNCGWYAGRQAIDVD